MSTRSVEIVFVDGTVPHGGNGAMRRRVALRIDGTDQDVVALKLDSDHARKQQIGAWAKAFDLDPAELAGKLRQAALAATADLQRRRSLRGVRGADAPPLPPIPLAEARKVFGRWLDNPDEDLLDVVFGAVMAHRLEGDPVWLFVVGAPGDGKTELLRSLSPHPSAYMLSTLTPGALISGWDPKDGTDPSLLPKLDGKILIVKDFTAILTMRNEDRHEVLGTLRDVYDGEAAKAFGTGETRSYKSRFGLLAAVTPYIDACWGISAQLGERFLRIRLPPSDHEGRQSKAKKALGNANAEEVMRKELSDAAMGVLAQNPTIPSVPADVERRLISLADFVALSRSEVSRDRQGTMQYTPSPEVGTRVGKVLKKLYIGIVMARGADAPTEDVYRIVRRVGLDTVPSMRGRLLEVLWSMRGNLETTATIGNEAELPTETVKVWLDDLRALRIVERSGKQHGGYTWRLRDDFQGTIQAAGLWSECDAGGWGGYSAPLTENCDSEPETAITQKPTPSPEAIEPPADAVPQERTAEPDEDEEVPF